MQLRNLYGNATEYVTSELFYKTTRRMYCIIFRSFLYRPGDFVLFS